MYGRRIYVYVYCRSLGPAKLGVELGENNCHRHITKLRAASPFLCWCIWVLPASCRARAGTRQVAQNGMFCNIYNALGEHTQKVFATSKGTIPVSSRDAWTDWVCKQTKLHSKEVRSAYVGLRASCFAVDSVCRRIRGSEMQTFALLSFCLAVFVFFSADVVASRLQVPECWLDIAVRISAAAKMILKEQPDLEKKRAFTMAFDAIAHVRGGYMVWADRVGAFA